MSISGFFGNIFVKPADFATQDELNIHNALNEVRKDAGVPLLVFDDELCKLARIRAEEQLESKGHVRPDGTRFYTIFLDHDVHYQSVGENICITPQYDVERVVNGWYDSESHRENMIDAKWEKTGIGIFKTDEKTYIVQLFAC